MRIHTVVRVLMVMVVVVSPAVTAQETPVILAETDGEGRPGGLRHVGSMGLLDNGLIVLLDRQHPSVWVIDPADASRRRFDLPAAVNAHAITTAGDTIRVVDTYARELWAYSAYGTFLRRDAVPPSADSKNVIPLHVGRNGQIVGMRRRSVHDVAADSAFRLELVSTDGRLVELAAIPMNPVVWRDTVTGLGGVEFPFGIAGGGWNVMGDTAVIVADGVTGDVRCVDLRRLESCGIVRTGIRHTAVSAAQRDSIAAAIAAKRGVNVVVDRSPRWIAGLTAVVTESGTVYVRVRNGSEWEQVGFPRGTRGRVTAPEWLEVHAIHGNAMFGTRRRPDGVVEVVKVSMNR